MKFFLLRWNPNISSWKDADFRKALAACRSGSDCVMNWSIREWSSLERGDWALLCRVGCGDDDGVVMAGRFTGTVFEEDSWRRDGTKCHYADVDMIFVNDPSISGLFKAADMDIAASGIDWHGGHSGVILSPEEAEKTALFLAEALARLDNPRREGFATSRNRGETATWLASCSLLSDLCPKVKADVFAKKKKSSALDFPRLVEEGCEIYFDARDVPSALALADILRPVSWEGVFRVDEFGAKDFNFVPVDRRRRPKRTVPAACPASRRIELPDGRELRLEKGDLFEVAKEEIEGLAVFLPCGLTALRSVAMAFLSRCGVPVQGNGELAFFNARPIIGRPLRRIACCMYVQHRLYDLNEARTILGEAFAAFEAVGCRIVGMNGFRMEEGSEQRTLDLVRDWIATHSDSTIRKVFLIDKRTGFRTAK